MTPLNIRNPDLELVEVCLLRGVDSPLLFLVLGPSVMAGVDLTSSVERQKNSSSAWSSCLLLLETSPVPV